MSCATVAVLLRSVMSSFFNRMRGSRTCASSRLSLICKTVLTEVLQSITSVRFKTYTVSECIGIAVIVPYSFNDETKRLLRVGI